MIRLERFDKSSYPLLISWVDSEETLMQFGGPGFSYPLTPEQLDQSLEDKNRLAFSVINVETNEKIGHCEICLLEGSSKLGRILIGDKQNRGKGWGQQIVNELIKFTFRHLERKKIELNVFEWNTGAIKCYEKVGFRINPAQKLERKIKGQTWIAINMILDNDEWNRRILLKAEIKNREL